MNQLDFSNKKFEAKTIPIDLINFPISIFQIVNRNSLDYIELRDSIKSVGLLNSICVRKSTYRVNTYDLIDGLHRYIVHKDLGLKEISAIIFEDIKDEEIPWLQIHANAHRREASPAKYAAYIRRLILKEPNVSVDELCVRLNKRPSWIKQVLTLLNLSDKVKEALELGHISALAAYSIARLPKKMQDKILPHALILPGLKIGEIVGNLIRSYREAKHKGELDEFLEIEIKAPRYLRTYKQICTEYETIAVGELFIDQLNITEPLEAWKLALAWILHVDPESEKRHRYLLEKKYQNVAKYILERRLSRRRNRIAQKMGVENNDIKEVIT